MDTKIKTILQTAKQQYHQGHTSQLIITDYHYPPKVRENQEIMISDYVTALKSQQIYNTNKDASQNKHKLQLPLLFAYLTTLTTHNRYQEAVRIIQANINRNQDKNYHILTYIIAKLYELAAQYKKQVFHLQNTLKSHPFFNHAIFDLCLTLSSQLNRQQDAINILERHLNGQLAQDKYIQSLYIFLCSKNQHKNAKQICKTLNGHRLSICNYFNLALYLSHNRQFQKAAKIFIDIISKLTKAKSQQPTSFTAKDHKLIIMAKCNLLVLYQQWSAETNTGHFHICETAQSLLEQQSELDKNTVQQLQHTIRSCQQKKYQLGQSYYKKLAASPSPAKTKADSTSKQNTQNYHNEYSDFRQYNNKKLQYLLIKEKQINTFFNNLVLRKQQNSYQIQYNSSLSNTLFIKNQHSIVRQAKINLNQQDIQVFQKQFQQKSKLHQLQFNNIQLESIIEQIINNLSNSKPSTKIIKPNNKVTVNRVQQSISQPASMKHSKNSLRTQTQNRTNRNLRPNQSKQYFRIKPTIKKVNKTIIQNPIQKEYLQTNNPAKSQTLPNEQNQQTIKQEPKQVPILSKKSLPFIVLQNLKETQELNQKEAQKLNYKEIQELNQKQFQQPKQTQQQKCPNLQQQPLIIKTTSPPLQLIDSKPINPLENADLITNTLEQTSLPNDVVNQNPIIPSCDAPIPSSPQMPLVDTKTISEVSPVEVQQPPELTYNPIMSSFPSTSPNINKSLFSKPLQQNNKPIAKNKTSAQLKYNQVLQNQLSSPQQQSKTKFDRQLQQAQKLIVQQQYDQAFQIYTLMYKKFKKQHEKQLILIKIAELYEKQHKYPQAQKTYLKCIKFNNADAFFKLGSLLLRNGRTKSGVENLQKANCINRNNLQIENKLIYGYSLRPETMQKALNLAHLILRKQPQSLQTLIVIANILQKQGNIKSAIQIMTAIDQTKSAQYIKHYLGILHLEDSNLTQAFNHFKSALNLKPDYVPSLIQVATIISDISSKQSIEILKKVLEIQPNNRKALTRLAKIYESIENDFQNAMTTYKAALQSQQNYQSYIKIGDCLLKQQSYIQALVNYQQAVVLRKTHEGYAKIATIYQKKGQYKKSIEHYEQALNILSTSKQTNTSSVQKQYLKAIGKLNLAIFEYDNAITAFEGVLEQQQSLQILTLIADAQFGKKQYNIALQYYEKANQLAAGQNIQILQNIAICFDKLQQYLASKTIYQKILQKDPQNTKCMNNLANILLITGQTNQAFYLFQNMLQKLPKNIQKRFKLAQIYAFVGDWSKVQYHLLECYHQKQNDPLILQKLINLYKEKRDSKLVNKYQKKLALLKDSHKHHKENK